MSAFVRWRGFLVLGATFGAARAPAQRPCDDRGHRRDRRCRTRPVLGRQPRARAVDPGECARRETARPHARAAWRAPGLRHIDPGSVHDSAASRRHGVQRRRRVPGARRHDGRRPRRYHRASRPPGRRSAGRDRRFDLQRVSRRRRLDRDDLRRRAAVCEGARRSPARRHVLQSRGARAARREGARRAPGRRPIHRSARSS